MILHSNFRDNGGGEQEIGIFPQTPLDALESLVVAEIGWGGSFTVFTATKLEIRTGVMHCKDRTVFEGPADEMELLVKAAYAAMILRQEHGDELINLAADDLERLPEGAKGVPLFVTTLGPKFFGERLGLAAVAAASGLTEEADLQVLLALSRLGSHAMIAALRLQAEGLSIGEAADKLRDAMSRKVTDEQLYLCGHTARNLKLSFADALEATASALSNGFPREAVADLLSLARDSGQSVADVAKELAPPAKK